LIRLIFYDFILDECTKFPPEVRTVSHFHEEADTDTMEVGPTYHRPGDSVCSSDNQMYPSDLLQL
jgi:hypothetical protein